ncbi:GNAT family N-acetyltransferase [Siphonobacter aquaeclarae]|uniref:N-acetyltransferase domain-containing protein n=1 Tax=Siphonobacter aquaeclarae TaxID=563176 RepID=A0A1G9IC23_9BACT|nr:GNAT family N-acetyltransferase [Siphonobacter aquaeclarae]SDL22759.1 hypothetical protein SAMN04488090_0418 [Siphonobacter aquaeclarae]
MEETYAALALINNTDLRQFEMPVGSELARITYKQTPHRIYLLHTEVSEGLKGKGAATAIIEKTLRYIEDRQLKLVPICPMVVSYLKRHPEWNRVVYEEIPD